MTFARQSVLRIALVALPFALIGFSGSGVAQAEIHALLVGIVSDDQHADLAGARYDIVLMEQVLTREYQVPSRRITKLLEQNATLANVRKEFHRLRREMKPDDVLIFHFSGHGSRINDDNGDEALAQPGDTYDEALMLFNDKDQIEFWLRDDELGRLLDEVPCRRSIVILDCCHSSTGTRGPLDSRFQRFHRYRSLPMPQIGNAATAMLAAGVHPVNATTVATFREQIAGPSGAVGIKADSPEGTHTKPVHSALGADLRETGHERTRVVFSGCRADQINYEMTLGGFDAQAPIRVGSLTYFLVEAIRGAADANGDGLVTYREAMEHVTRRIDSLYNGAQQQIQGRQTPVLEVFGSASVEERFLAGQTKISEFAIATLRADRQSVELDRGLIHGWCKGATLGLFPLNALGLPDKRRSLGEITVVTIEDQNSQASVLNIDPSVGVGNAIAAMPRNSPLDPPDLRILVVAQAPVNTERNFAASFKRRLDTQFANIPGVRLGNDRQLNDLVILISQTDDALGKSRLECVCQDMVGNAARIGPFSFELTRRSNGLQAANPADLEQFFQRSAEWSRVQVGALRLRRCFGSLVNKNQQFELQLVTQYKPDASLNGYLLNSVDDGLKMAIKAGRDCEFALLALAPDGQLTVLHDTEAKPGHLQAGQAALFPGPGKLHNLKQPGVHLIKLIATQRGVFSGIVKNGHIAPGNLASLPLDTWAEASIVVFVR